MIHSYLSVIRNSHFRNLWLAQIASQIALNMLYFVLAIAVYEKTHSNAAVSSMVLAYGLPAILFGVAAGSIVDNYDKRKILFFCNAVRTLLFVAFFFSFEHLPVLYLLTIIMSMVTQLFIPAEVPALPSLLPSEKLLTANSLFTVSFSLATVTGFILAGPAIRVLGHQGSFVCMGLSMAVASYCAYRLPPIPSKSKKARRIANLTIYRKTVQEAFDFIRKHRRIRESLALLTLSQALMTTLSMLAPGFADKILSIELTDASFLVMGPAAAGLVIGAAWVGGYGTKFKNGTMIDAGIGSTAFLLLLLSVITSGNQAGLALHAFGGTIALSNLIVAFFLLTLLGIGNSLINVPASTILQQDTEESIRGRIYGFMTAATGGVSMLPVVGSGVLADIIGVAQTLFFLGILVLGIWVYDIVRKRRT